ncbi:MAG: hypothetical protein JXA90_01100, partial [Planctomycetes bacterium]|nr:hypothetical protein [Planctomycetota bacterium]
AHGGWDAWRHVVRLEYERSRTRSARRGEVEEGPESGDEPAMEASPAAGRPALETGDAGEEPPRPEVARVVLARSDARGPWRLARLSAGADPADASALGARVEAIASTAPFAFVDRGLHAADLGVELDAASGYSLRKVQFAERSGEGPFLCIAYFDAQAYVLRRLLFPRPGGEGFLMVIVTDCDPIGETGVLLALRRQAFVLEKRFSRIPRRAPLYEETLSLISTEVKTAAGE